MIAPSTQIARHRHRAITLASGLAIASLLAAACADSDKSASPIVGPAAYVSSHDEPSVKHDRRNTSVRWNEVARSLVASHNTNGPLASRVYALVSVAQFAASLSIDGDDRRRDDPHSGSESRGVGLDAAIARASANVLTGLYPDPGAAAVIDSALNDDEQLVDGHPAGHGSEANGDAIGAKVAQAVLAHAAADGAAAANCPATPPLPASQFWHDDAVPPNPQPLLPCFGQVHTWLGIDVTQFRADPPPAFGSAAFVAGVAEVRQISDTRTAAQLAIVDKWLDGNNSFQPPGRWNAIASDLATQHRLDASSAARMFAVLNMVMMDTHIACWDRKYTFWEIRPWQVDPFITTPRGQAHHPSNPSGHACAGGAGSAALGPFFPAQRDSLDALGNEQGFSTTLAGVHYRFDVDKGLQIGRAIAARAFALHDVEDLVDQFRRP